MMVRQQQGPLIIVQLLRKNISIYMIIIMTFHGFPQYFPRRRQRRVYKYIIT